MNHRVVSACFPYLPLEVRVGTQTMIVEALLDTGFDGDLVLPTRLQEHFGRPDGSMTGILADSSPVRVPVYAGQVRLGETVISSRAIMLLGDEVLVGRGVSDRFTIILDHGRQVIVEP